MDNELRTLVDLRDRTLQKARIAFSNRVSAIERGVDDGNKELVKRWQQRFQELETACDQDIAILTKDTLIIQDMRQLKGIGNLLAAKLVSLIDINRADTVSALWRYCGYACIDGQRERPTKGEKLHYNTRAKTTCYLIATSFMRCGSPYREIYDKAKEFYESNRLDWTKSHIHQASMRKMIKIFLAHLWEHWRLLEGLSAESPYILLKPEHTHAYKRLDFGWPPLD